MAQGREAPQPGMERLVPDPKRMVTDSDFQVGKVPVGDAKLGRVPSSLNWHPVPDA